MNINKRQVAAYTMLPGIFPRFKSLVVDGFGWLAYLIAHIYYAVRLLPQGHPYLLSENKGRYGIRLVVAAAAKNLRFELKYIDQVLIFGVILVGLVLLVSQIVLIIFGFIFSKAYAGGMFETMNPDSDNAFMLLDFVFGVPGFFGSCALGTDDPANATIAPCVAGSIPVFGAAPVYAYHAGLHSLLEFYSWSLLFVAVLIFIYFVVVIIAETASTGVPFGARFNTVWGPIRLLVAIGLLIPVAYGLNSGQYLTLAIAKLGSGLATNGWLAYNDTVAANYASRGYANPNVAGMGNGGTGQGGSEHLLPRPNMSDASPFIASMQLVKACEYAYMKARGFINERRGTVEFQPIRPWLVKPGIPPVALTDPDNTVYVGVSRVGAARFRTGGGGIPFDNYDIALAFFDYGDVVIRFGAPVPGANDPDTIIPYCGEVTLTTTTAAPIMAGSDPAGAWHLQKGYYEMLIDEWFAEENTAIAARYTENKETGFGEWFRPCLITDLDFATTSIFDPDPVLSARRHALNPGSPECYDPPSSELKTSHFMTREVYIEGYIQDAWLAMLAVPDLYDMTSTVRERGWAAAGMWYNNLASVIGREFDAAANIPYMSRVPAVMDEISKHRMALDNNLSLEESYNPQGVSDGRSLKELMSTRDMDIGWVLYNVHKDWQESGIASGSISIMADDNLIERVMHGIFGTKRLMNILEEEYFDVHPMAQLVAIGKDLVNSTLMNVVGSLIFAVGSGMQEASKDSVSGPLMGALSSALSSIALIGLTAGFLLFYVLPFMPFLYFFFAVGTWVKTIFEAMVGVPLWALAHIRIDKEGLPGDAAANGYFLLLEIFVRPILIVFSLIASFIIFGAMVRVLHEIFDLVVQNVMGNDEELLTGFLGEFTPDGIFKRAIIDEFFFTVIYVMTVYMIGLSCFKLIDNIPQSILRWAGAGVRSFGDSYQDPAENLTQYAAVGGYLVGRQGLQGLRQGAQGLGRMGGSMINGRLGQQVSGAKSSATRLVSKPGNVPGSGP